MIINRRRRGKMMYLYFSYQKREIWVSTKIRISDEFWDEKRNKILQKIVHLFEPDLHNAESCLISAIKKLEQSNTEVNSVNIRRILENKTRSIVDAFDEYVQRKSRVVKPTTLKKIMSFRDKLQRFEQVCPTPLDPENFTREQYEHFASWLSESEQLGDNTKSTRIATLRNFLREENPDRSYSFIKSRQKYDNVIYLYLSELEIIRQAKLTGYLEKARDVFLAACLTGVRYEDYNKISELGIKGHLIEVMQTKTASMAYIPVTDELRRLLKKYDGEIPKISNQKMNDYLKILFTRLKLNRKVVIYKRYRGEPVRKVIALHEFVSTHIARKTFIMTLLNSGVDAKLVMEMSGHRNWDSFRHYVTISKRHLAKAAASINMNKLFNESND